MGFFTKTQTVGQPRPLPLIPQCGACGLLRTCNSPKMPVSGEGRLKVLIVGEAPGRTEDEKNKQFVGRAGRRVRGVLRDIGIDDEKDVWWTNSLICRPPNNATPTLNQIEFCRPNLTRTISELNPNVVILLGMPAVQSFIGPMIEVGDKIYRWVGRRIPCQKPNTWACITYHPSFIDRCNSDPPRPTAPVVTRMFENHLRAAFDLAGSQPWQEPPDYGGRVTVELDPVRAALSIRVITAGNRPAAWDIESVTLAPYGPHAEIYTSAISDGITTISYPWLGEAIKATDEFTLSPQPKISSNLKMEESWSIKHLGHPVRNWAWDTVLGGHTLDNRPKCAGLKFQAFVRKGQSDYASHLKPYMVSQVSNTPNKIKQADLRSVLLYGGLDALLEFEVAMDQAAEMGVTI